jgi:ADP-ribose pyrophosphatase YjhB (NUDIX family)
MVRPTYKDYWDVPGGCVEPGESPQAACRRELKEELGVEAGTLTFVSVDWAPTETEGDKLLFLFEAPELRDKDWTKAVFPDGELAEARYVDLSGVDQFTIPRLARRLTASAAALATRQFPVYLEHGAVPDEHTHTA